MLELYYRIFIHTFPSLFFHLGTWLRASLFLLWCQFFGEKVPVFNIEKSILLLFHYLFFSFVFCFSDLHFSILVEQYNMIIFQVKTENHIFSPLATSLWLSPLTKQAAGYIFAYLSASVLNMGIDVPGVHSMSSTFLCFRYLCVYFSTSEPMWKRESSALVHNEDCVMHWYSLVVDWITQLCRFGFTSEVNLKLQTVAGCTGNLMTSHRILHTVLIQYLWPKVLHPLPSRCQLTSGF